MIQESGELANFRTQADEQRFSTLLTYDVSLLISLRLRYGARRHHLATYSKNNNHFCHDSVDYFHLHHPSDAKLASPDSLM